MSCIETPFDDVCSCSYCGKDIVHMRNVTVLLLLPRITFCNENCAVMHLGDMLDCNQITEACYLSGIGGMYKWLGRLRNGKGFWECAE